ncbi:hypothetical protein STCU_09546 [Strigomonas culicis]|uniref:Guanine nucleotide-binding protein subunit beta-like protein n=1 Tax=Strigomonas culicis TaxID=28005 RepID=S9TRP5_9TRYP|nr:hypothetical protein STCU_09546 [Strigomonas culicis]|eukprot:EPY19274.1 hypothetical protein STCU_09546 [Strigomonas culicis]
MFQPSGEGGGKSGRVACDPGIPFTSSLIVDVAKNETTRTETVQIITSWLIDQGYTSSAQLLREEATSQLRGEHQQRKVLRSMCRAVEEGAWDAAQKNLKKLLSKAPAKGSAVKLESTSQIAALTRSLPFLLTQQQFLELVDSDDNQKAYTFFMKSVKPFESSINREHFQRLNYLLTCKTVAESASIYAEYQNWTPDAGRFQIVRVIQNAMGCSSSYPYCRQSNVAAAAPPRDLDDLVRQALSFELLQGQFPSLTKDMAKVRVDSLFAPLQARLPPKEPLMAIDLNEIMREKFPLLAPKGDRRVRITACQPFLSSSAVVVSTHDGAVLWTPLESVSASYVPRSSFAHDEVLLYTHKYPVRGLARHESKLLCWGGSQAVVLNLALLVDAPTSDAADTFDRSKCVTNIFTHAAETYCSCFFPCGTIVATGLSEGTVTVWDAVSGTKCTRTIATR